MNTPVLRAVHPDPRLRALAGLSDHERCFEVVRSGQHGGRRYRAGDLLVCTPGDATADAPWVLVPCGVGRPVLGAVVDGVLYGSSGERCHPVRWSAAGALRGQWRAVGQGWAQVTELVAAPLREQRPAVQALPCQRRPVRRAAPRAQLALFASAAA